MDQAGFAINRRLDWIVEDTQIPEADEDGASSVQVVQGLGLLLDRAVVGHEIGGEGSGRSAVGEK